MDADLWRSRNRRPMGLHTAFPFLSRPMTKGEIDWRLCYHKYEDWDKLLYAEEKEAEDLDLEIEGAGRDFLNQLKSFRERFPLNADLAKLPPGPHELPAGGETIYLRELIDTGDALSAAEVAKLLDGELQTQKRPAVLTACASFIQIGMRNSPLFILILLVYKSIQCFGWPAIIAPGAQRVVTPTSRTFRFPVYNP
jgi:hypothetical protein